ncbi:MAG: carboxypeptidase regulatory-like domain-containing protein [Sulfuricaulis sp.]|nr:carboxypeptidase regulatory-like domain-containing protein [Sulfuricaulis sp.]
MKQVRWAILIPICLFILGVNAAEAAEYAVQAGGVKNGGTVYGRVIFKGTPPPPKMMKVDEDVATCGPDRPSEALLVSKSGGIKNVVLSIEGIQSGKKWDFPKEFVYDQKKCRFVPRVLLIKPKSKGVVLNSDPVGHNFHTVSKGIYNVNKKIKADAKMVVAEDKIRRSGTVRAKCDIHSWMEGWWVVAETPYTVLSDENGNFSIKDIPPGTYKLKIWHEKLGESQQPVVIETGKTTELSINLKL